MNVILNFYLSQLVIEMLKHNYFCLFVTVKQVNLSCADTMVSTLNVIFNFTYMVTNDWPFGRLYCKITQYVAVISICGSVFTLMAISIERYCSYIFISILSTAHLCVCVFYYINCYSNILK